MIGWVTNRRSIALTLTFSVGTGRDLSRLRFDFPMSAMGGFFGHRVSRRPRFVGHSLFRATDGRFGLAEHIGLSGAQELRQRAEVFVGVGQIAMHRGHVVALSDAVDRAGIPGNGAVPLGVPSIFQRPPTFLMPHGVLGA